MADYLLDTNVLSEVLKKKPAPSVLARLRAVPAASLFTSSICVMELRYGAVRQPSGAALWNRIVSEALSRVSVLGLGAAAGQRAGEILAALDARGEPIGIEDVLIAATAQDRDLTVVTRNVKHFSRIEELRVENWWA